MAKRTKAKSNIRFIDKVRVIKKNADPNPSELGTSVSKSVPSGTPTTPVQKALGTKLPLSSLIQSRDDALSLLWADDDTNTGVPAPSVYTKQQAALLLFGE